MPLIAPGPDVSRFELLRTSIHAQLVERDADFPAYAPVFPWNLVSRAYRYVFDLPATALRQIRLHADTINGTLGATYYLNYPALDGRTAAEASGYLFLGEGVPRSAWAREQAVPGIEELRWGYKYEELTIADITVTRQQNLCNIHRLLAASSPAPGRSVFTEIGGGYGSFALDALQAFPGVCYVIVDLPETLIYSASYLATHRPDLRAFVYAPGDDIAARLADVDSYDLAFLPNYRAQALEYLPYIDVGINTISFPEMGARNAREYLSLMTPKLRRFFLSVNHRDFRQESDRGTPLDSLLGAHMRLFPSLADYEAQLGVGEAQHRDITFWPTTIGFTDRCIPVRGVELRCANPTLGRFLIRAPSLADRPTMTRAR